MIDLLLVNGLVRTMDPQRPTAGSIACRDGRVESLDQTPPARRVIDLKGAAVVPGFIDAHAHLAWIGRRRRQVDLDDAGDADEIVRRIAEHARTVPPGAWIIGFGHTWTGETAPAGLSAEIPEHPVWLVRKDAHSGLANARALAAAGVPEPLRERGVLREEEMRWVERVLPSEPRAADLLSAQREAIPLGIVGVHDAWVDEEGLRALQSLDDGRSLRLRVHAMAGLEGPERLVEFMRSRPPRPGSRLAVRAVKVFMDGSLGSGTAWMLDPPRGVVRTPPEALEEVARTAKETGWQLCVHAIGDAANRAVLDVFDRVDPPAEARWRIEHAQHVDPEDLPRFRRWIASVQPSHRTADGPLLGGLSAREREGSYAWTRLGRLALGSDAPVDRFDPRWTFWCATAGEGERLSPEAALAGMTAGAAWAGFMDGGVLAPGRPADMVVLSCDWVTAPP
ncbi:MAG TPA: amidohydrolase, partial [Planctomycetota bacterium]|nr:amidohydrolase [Planctomycetota bacterium]